MEPTDTVRFHAASHPAPLVRRAGFALDHPYLEQCWAPAIGPTSVLLLRRIPQLWQDDLAPVIASDELAASIGLGRSHGRNGALWRTLERIVRFRFATVSGPGELDVFTEVPPLRQVELERLPAWNRRRHNELLGAHLDRLAELQQAAPSPNDISARLDHMTTRSTIRNANPSLHR